MKTKNLLVSIAVIVLLGAVIWYWSGKVKSGENSIDGISPLGDKALESQPGINKATVESAPSFFSRIFSGGEKTYTDSSANFSFKYPKEYSIKEIPAPAEGEARTLLLSKEGKAPSVQVAVSAFDEDIVLTAERIAEDAPEFVMNNPQAVSVGSLTKGVKFDTDSGANIWFVAKGNLFQLTALPAEAGVLDQIVSTFKI